MSRTLDRCRMALTEIGLDPNLVRVVDGRIRLSRRVDDETGWLLHCTVSGVQPLCLPCFTAMQAQQRRNEGLARPDCMATRRFQRAACVPDEVNEAQ